MKPKAKIVYDPATGKIVYDPATGKMVYTRRGRASEGSPYLQQRWKPGWSNVSFADAISIMQSAAWALGPSASGPYVRNDSPLSWSCSVSALRYDMSIVEDMAELAELVDVQGETQLNIKVRIASMILPDRSWQVGFYTSDSDAFDSAWSWVTNAPPPATGTSAGYHNVSVSLGALKRYLFVVWSLTDYAEPGVGQFVGFNILHDLYLDF